MRSVERIFQPKAGEAEVDRQRSGDLVVAVVEQIRRVGDRRGNAVAQHVDDDRPPVEMAEVEQLEPKVPAGRSEQRLVRLEANIAPRVEIERGNALGQRRDRRVERRARKIPRALDHLALSEGGHGRGGWRRVLLGEGGPEPSPGGSANHADEYGAAVEALHGAWARMGGDGA